MFTNYSMAGTGKMVWILASLILMLYPDMDQDHIMQIATITVFWAGVVLDNLGHWRRKDLNWGIFRRNDR